MSTTAISYLHERARYHSGHSTRQPGNWRIVLLALLVVLIAGDPGRIDRQKTWLRIITAVVIAYMTLADLLAAGRLVLDILEAACSIVLVTLVIARAINVL